MIKIEDTYQEEEETPQKTMTTSVEDSMTQKTLKALVEHGEALKKMGGRLTRLKESKLKKSSHVEINDDEEEVEEWEEAHRKNHSHEGEDGENETRLPQGTRDG